jgi:hypothetical protein
VSPANPDLFIVNVALSDIARDFGGATLDDHRGLERLCHRPAPPLLVFLGLVRGLSPRPCFLLASRFSGQCRRPARRRGNVWMQGFQLAGGRLARF